MFRQGFSDESWNSLEKVGSAQADSARAFILDVMGSSDEGGAAAAEPRRDGSAGSGDGVGDDE